MGSEKTEVVENEYTGKRLYSDEIELEVVSALGLKIGSVVIDKRDKKALIDFVLKSRSMKSHYFFLYELVGKKVVKKEITDGVSYGMNPNYYTNRENDLIVSANPP